MTDAQPFTRILDKVQRAAKNGERLHLDVELVRALYASPIYAALNDLHAEEMVSQWQAQPVSRSDNSGSTTERKEMTGPLPGTIAPLVQDAESRLALEAATRIIHQTRRKRRSQLITQATPTPSKQKSLPTRASHQS